VAEEELLVGLRKCLVGPSDWSLYNPGRNEEGENEEEKVGLQLDGEVCFNNGLKVGANTRPIFVRTSIYADNKRKRFL